MRRDYEPLWYNTITGYGGGRLIYLQGLIIVIGLLIDIIGAWFISRGLATKTTDEFISEAVFTYGVNDSYIISGMRQHIECKYGFGLLFLGFGMQLIAQLYIDKIGIISISVFSLTVLIVILFVITMFLLFNGRVKVEYEKKANEYLKEKIIKALTAGYSLHVIDCMRYLRYTTPDIGLDSSELREELEKKLRERFTLPVDLAVLFKGGAG